MNRWFLTFLLSLFFASVSGQTNTIDLNEAIKIGLTNNHALKAVFQDIQISQGKYKENFFLPFPTLNAEYKEVPKGESLTNAGEKTLYIEQEFEFPLRYPAKIKS